MGMSRTCPFPWPLVGVLHLTIDAFWEEEGRDAMTSGLLPFGHRSHRFRMHLSGDREASCHPARLTWLLTLLLTCTWQMTPELAQGDVGHVLSGIAGNLPAWHVG